MTYSHQKKRSRGQGGFGSTGVDFTCLSLELNNRPTREIAIKNEKFIGLLDTGADKSIIKLSDWPQEWPIQKAIQTLRGLGTAINSNRSAEVLPWKDEEGHTGLFQPYILENLPINLWGRDILVEMNLRLTSDIPYSSEATNQIMLAQGHIWGKGLGKEQQGISTNIEVIQKTDRRGLGFPEGPLRN